jgi:hypothetical protein
VLKRESTELPQLPLWIEFFLTVSVIEKLITFPDRGQFIGCSMGAVSRARSPPRRPSTGLSGSSIFGSMSCSNARKCRPLAQESIHWWQKNYSRMNSRQQRQEILRPMRQFIASDNASRTSTNWWRRWVRKSISTPASTRDVDELLASLDPAEWHPDARREVLVNYLGFAFWDVLTLSVTAGARRWLTV